jgi:hypothetical protein
LVNGFKSVCVAKSLAGHQAKPALPLLDTQLTVARHSFACFLSFCDGVSHPLKFTKVNSTIEAWLFILDPAHTQIISFPPFFLLYSAATAGDKNGVEGHKDGVKNAVLVTKAEWRSHEWSAEDRALVTSESQKRSKARIF